MDGPATQYGIKERERRKRREKGGEREKEEGEEKKKKERKKSLQNWIDIMDISKMIGWE
jgi:hypothetical protein